jgi:general secretion pathway protein A
VIDEFDPCAVVVLGSSDDDLACSLLANKRGVRLLRVGSGQRDRRGTVRSQLNAVLIERVVDLHFTESTESFYALYREGIRLDRVRSVGDLTKEMFENSLAIIDSRPDAPQAGTPAPGEAFGLVRADLDAAQADGAAMKEIVDLLCACAKELPLVWVTRTALVEQLRKSVHGAALKRSRVTIVADSGYLATLALLRRSRSLLALEEGALMEAARALQLPAMLFGIDAPTEANAAAAPGSSIDSDAPKDRLRLARLLAEGPPVHDKPEYWHTGTASRIAGQLVNWLPNASSSQPSNHRQRNCLRRRLGEFVARSSAADLSHDEPEIHCPHVPRCRG